MSKVRDEGHRLGAVRKNKRMELRAAREGRHGCGAGRKCFLPGLQSSQQTGCTWQSVRNFLRPRVCTSSCVWKVRVADMLEGEGGRYVARRVYCSLLSYSHKPSPSGYLRLSIHPVPS
jgi:hypothetical protein